MSQMGALLIPGLEAQEEERMPTVLGKSWNHRFQELNHYPNPWSGWVRGGSWSVLTFASHSSVSCGCPPLARPNRKTKRMCHLLYPTSSASWYIGQGENGSAGEDGGIPPILTTQPDRAHHFILFIPHPSVYLPLSETVLFIYWLFPLLPTSNIM